MINLKLTRVATSRNPEKYSIIIECENKIIMFSAENLSVLDTEENIRQAAETSTGLLFKNFFFHKNRDGSYAIAVGSEPNFWPEDAYKYFPE